MRSKPKVKPLKPLDKAQKLRLQEIAYQGWQYIGGDVMQAVAEGGEGDSIKREDVIEVVLDAGRFEDDVAKKAPELLEWVKNADYKMLKAVVRPAFPYARYS